MSMSISPDSLCAMGSYVAREWGDYGYWFEKIEAYDMTGRVHIGHVVCGDGSRFQVVVDRWGNCDYSSIRPTEEIAQAMYAKACEV